MIHYRLLLPEILVGSLALLLIVADLLVMEGPGTRPGEMEGPGTRPGKNNRNRRLIPQLAGLGLFFIFLFTCFHRDPEGFSLWNTVEPLHLTLPGGKIFQGFIFDRFALFFKDLFLLAALAVTYLSMDFLKTLKHGYGEFYALLLTVVLGMMFMVSSAELLLLFVAIELTSIPLYVMAAFRRPDPPGRKIGEALLAGEAGLKYFLLGALASALLLYGMSLVYAATGSTLLDEIARRITPDLMHEKPALFVGLLFMLGGLAFKIAAVPFHMWAPDVYEGAPTPVTAFLSVAPKAAGIAVLLRFFTAYFASGMDQWGTLFAALAAMSMIVGNLLALHQENVKRMLAYSGIAQIGYVLVGLAAAHHGNPLGREGAVFYLVAYVITNLTAFGALIALSVAAGTGEFVSDWKGLAQRSPWLALIMLTALLSLAGVPPLAGFIGKFYLFMGAVNAGLLWLAAIGVITSVISLFYYLRIARAMYLEEASPVSTEPLLPTRPIRAVLLVASFAIVLLGLFPAPLATASSLIFKLFLPAPLP